MATFFSLNDGNLTDAGVFGRTLSSADVTSVTAGVMLGTTDNYSLAFTGDGSSISAVAVQLSARAANPVGTLTMNLSSGSGVITETYAISSFTSYDGSNNLITTYPQNWQILKLTNPYTISNGASAKLNLKTSNSNQLSLVGSGSNYNKSLITTASPSLLSSGATNLSGTATLLGSPVLSSASPFGVGTDSSIQTLSSPTAAPYVNFNTTLTTTNGAIFGSNDFTIEMFLNYSVVSGTTDTLFVNYATIGFVTGCIYYGRHPSYSGRVAFWAADYSTSGALLVDPNPVTAGSWIHYALVRFGNRFDLYRDGVSVANATYTGSINSVYPESGFAGWFRAHNACVSNYRIVNGTAVYKSNFTVPAAPLSNVYNTAVLYKAPYNTTFLYADTTVDLHVGGALKGLTTEARTITADSFKTDNLYIHNQGKLAFPQTTAKISVEGSKGLQITSDGTLEIGTSANPIPANVTSTVSLVSSQLDVHNGGNLNVYGAYKQPSTYLVNNSTIGQRTFNVVDAVSSTWNVKDTVVFTPNTASPASFDVLTLSSFTDGSTFTTTSTTLCAHPSIATIDYIPSVSNLTRNVVIGGSSASLRGDVRVIDAAKANINNAQFINMGKAAAAPSLGFMLGTNSAGNINLSGNSFYTNVADTQINVSHVHTWTASRSSINNISLTNNTFFKPAAYGVYMVGVSADSILINNNLILSAGNGGMLINTLSGSNITTSNNVIAGSKAIHSNGILPVYGVQIYNCRVPLNGFTTYNNGYVGLAVLNGNYGDISNITSTYNKGGGIIIDGAISNLSSTTFSNITANNNTTFGLIVSGNTINHLSPITLNINNLVANNNTTNGFEAYCITGNLSSLTLNNNSVYGMKTSIGNGTTVIDGITSLIPNTVGVSAAIGILSGQNYFQTYIKNANVGKDTFSNTRGSGISLDSTKFSQFFVENSTVSGGSSDFQVRTTNKILEGSYLISNTNVGTLPVGLGINSTNYQSEVFKSTGFAFTNMNNISGYHVTYVAGGSRMIDTTVYINAASSPSERLTPNSSSIKLRSGSKFVALNSGDAVSVGVYVRKSSVATNGSGYNGTAPRLILKRNAAIGITSDIVMDQLDVVSENFLKLSGVTPTVTDNGVLEFYVDCDGNTGWINVDNWTAN